MLKYVLVIILVGAGIMTALNLQVQALDETTYAAVAIIFSAIVALPAILQLVKDKGRWGGLLIYTVIALVGLIMENIAIATGWPYGSFAYGALLGPKIINVPISLIFSYPPLVIGAYYLANRLRHKFNLKPLQFILLAVFLLIAIDLILDPGAVALGFWVWDQPGIYYGVPIINYLGWLISSLIVIAVLYKLLPQPSTQEIASNSYLANLFFWLGVTASLGYVGPAVLGIVFITLLKK